MSDGLVSRHMTAQPHTRRAVLTTGAAVAGAAVGTVALAACGSEDISAGSDGGADATNGQTSAAPGSSAPSGEAVTALSDVPVGSATSVTTPDGEEAIVSRKSETEVAAFSAICTHQGCTVTPEGADLKCPCHGSLFDAFTGEAKNGPATESLAPINVKIENDQVVTA